MERNETSPLGTPGAGGAFGLVAVCRPGDGDGSGTDRLVLLLEEAGLPAATYPLTRILPPRDPRPLERGARAILAGEVDVLLFTSARAVAPTVAALRAVDPAWTRPAGLEVWVVGEATGVAAEAAGLAPDRIPGRFVAEGIVEEATAPGAPWGPLQGRRILFPRAARGREVLQEELAAAGARVTLVEAYRTEDAPDEGLRLLTDARAGRIGAVTLTAGSQAWVLGRALGNGGLWPEGVPLVAIGPAAEAAALGVGLPQPVVADPHTLEGVVEAVRSARVSARKPGPA